jgi:hypothetical protein
MVFAAAAVSSGPLLILLKLVELAGKVLED